MESHWYPKTRNSCDEWNMNFIGRRRSLPHRNKGKSRRKEEHSLYPWVCDSTKMFSETDSSTCSCFWLTSYLLCLVWTCFSTNSRHTHGYKLCSSFRRLFPFREHFGRIRVFSFSFQNKICPFLTQGICIYVGHSFLWVGPTPLICLSA
jgi:hypothetical protein